MSRRTNTSTYHDPLNLVRVAKNPLETEALTVIQTMQAQRTALQSAGSFGNEFDEAEINLDKWKQRRKTSISKSSQESFGDSPPRSSTMQSSARFTTINQSPVVEKSSRGSERNAKQFSAKFNFDPENPSEKESFAINPDNGLLRRGNDLSNVTKKEERNLEGIILRTRTNSKQASESSVEQRQPQQQQDPVVKSYVRKSENRFKDAKAFFELSAKHETELLAPKPYKSANRSHQRMSWAPGMMERTFSNQPPAKLPIANDKEFTIEEIDLSKPVVRMSTSDNVFKATFTPRFVPNVESHDEAIMRKKSATTNERKSRVEVISMNLEDKEAPVISLDDFKSFITSPEVMGSEEKFELTKKPASHVSSLKREDVLEKDQSSKNTFLVENKTFKNKIFNEDLDLSKVSSSYKITKKDFDGAKQSNETFKDENVYNENEFIKEGLFKITDYNKDSLKTEIQKVTKPCQSDFPLSLEELEKKYKKPHVSKESQASFNNVTHTSALNEKVSDVFEKKMEDKKAFFGSDIKHEKKHEVSVKTTTKDKDIISSSALDEALSIREEYKNGPSENPFTLFEETYKNQLDELNERKARKSVNIPSDIFIEEKVDTTKFKKSDKIEKPSTFQTGIILNKSLNDDTFVDGNVLIKSDDSLRSKLKQQSNLKEQIKSSDLNTNLISFSNDKKERTISEKSDYKAEFLPKFRDTIMQKESTIEPKDPLNFSISSKEVPKSEDPLLKIANKAFPIVPPKPMSKTNKMIEKLSSSGFTPVLPGALPRRSKSMKVIGSAMTEATRGVEVGEGGVDMDKVSNSRPLLDTSAQKNKSAIARSANRRPPTMYQTKMHSFDCSNGFDSKSTGHKTPQSASEDELGRSPPNLPTRPPPKSSLENLDHLLFSTSPPRSTAIPFHKPVDYFDGIPKVNADRRRREEICEEEEESVV